MDSGTSTMAAPTNVFDKFKVFIKKEIHGDVNNVKSWPKVTFVIDAKNYDLEGNEIVTVNGKSTYQRDSLEGDDVVLSWQDFDSGNDLYNIWIAGDVFLSKFITIYDRDHDKVGIALPD